MIVFDEERKVVEIANKDFYEKVTFSKPADDLGGVVVKTCDADHRKMEFRLYEAESNQLLHWIQELKS